MAGRSVEEQFAEEQARLAISQKHLAREDNPELDPMRQEELDRNRVPAQLRGSQLSPNSESRSREAEKALAKGPNLSLAIATSLNDQPYATLALAALLGVALGAISKS